VSKGNLPEFSLRELLETGVHFGHQRHRWNPKMKPYIYGVKNGVHIVDLTKTYVMLKEALSAVRDTVARGGRVLFVGTKKRAGDIVSEAAKSCAQYYVNHRWLGGMMTNWNTVSESIKSLKELEEKIATPSGYTKKEILSMQRHRERVLRDLSGISDMGGIPTMLFVIDVNKEATAVKEANRLGIPVAAIVDTNANPDGVDFIIPGNDDSVRAISLYCDLVARAVIEGIRMGQENSGVDMGESADPVAEMMEDVTRLEMKSVG
jgi:small subunit ribosomal protein S2